MKKHYIFIIEATNGKRTMQLKLSSFGNMTEAKRNCRKEFNDAYKTIGFEITKIEAMDINVSLA